MIYFISDGEFVKVGTSRSLSQRLQTHRTSNAKPIEVLAVSDGDEKLERRLHKVLPRRLRKGGEWFGVSDVLLNLIATVDRAGFSKGKAAIESFISEAEAQRKVDWSGFEEAFDRAGAAVVTIACKIYGVKAVADAMNVTPAMVRLCRSGKARLSAASWAKLGSLNAGLLELLFPTNLAATKAAIERWRVAA